MESMGELRRAVAAYLRGASGLREVWVREAFPAAQRDFPLKKPVVAVAIDSVEAAPEGFGGYFGESEGSLLHGAGARIVLRFALYMPTGGDSEGLHGLYEALCDGLLLRENPFGARKLWCGETAYDKLAGAWRTTAWAALHSALLVREAPDRYERAALRRVEMGAGREGALKE